MSDPQCKTDNLFNNKGLMKKTNTSKHTPGRMDDGRYLTDYRNSTLVNEIIKMNNKIVKNDMYRKYLVDNTDDLKKKNIKNEKCEISINTCVFNHNTSRVDSSSFSNELKRYNDSMKVNILKDFDNSCSPLDDFLL